MPITLMVPRLIIMVLLLAGAPKSSQGQERPEAAAPRPDSSWFTYVNNKYGYSIRYPRGYELLATGKEGERDGTRIVIRLREVSALAPFLQVRIRPRDLREKFPRLGFQLKDMHTQTREAMIGDLFARVAQYRWKATGDVAFVEVYCDGVVFWFDPAADLQDFYETIWWSIIGTFRFDRK